MSAAGADKAADQAAALLAIIRELAAELHPGRPPPALGLDSALDRDLGLDSLARVELLTRVEQRFGIALPEQILGTIDTPRDLLRAMLSAGAPRAAMVPEISELSPGEARAAPHSARTLVEVLNWHVTTHPDRRHIQLYQDQSEGAFLSYRQLKQGAEAVATGLQQGGLEPGEPVAIMLPTGIDYFFSFFGILLAGGIPVPIYPPARLSQIEDHMRRHRGILANCRAVTLITVPEAKAVARLLKSQVETLRRLVTVAELRAAPGKLVEAVPKEQDIAMLQYTSGSTGNPKGVVLTHANLLANIRVMGEAIRADPTDVFVSWLPLYHDMGLIGAWLGSLYYAILLVLMSPLAFLARPQRWLWAIHRYRGTLSAAPNFGYELCLRKLEDRELEGLDLSSWRLAFNGAEAVSPDTVRRFAERLRPYGFRPETMTPVYGLAESCVGLAFPPFGRGPVIDRIQRDAFTRSARAVPAAADDATALRFVACGQPLPGHQIRVVDPSGRELPERMEGEIQFRGPSATSGYYRNAEATRALFRGDWLDAGDKGYIASGELFVTGRTKDIIVRAGRNIYPDELEHALGEIPGIRKGCVAVFGSTDPATGTERLVVLAETRETDPLSLDRLRNRIVATTTDIIGTPPDDVALKPPHTILKTSSGKIRRAASRESYERGRLRRPARAPWWQITRLAVAGLGAQLRRLRRRTTEGLYAAWAWTLYGLMAPAVWLGVVLLPRASWRWSFMRGAGRTLARASGTPLRVQGLEHLPPPGRACILVANHASYLDGYVLVTALPREFSFVAKVEFKQSFIIRIFLRRIQAEFVERFDKQKGISDARHVAGTLRAGRSLLFFPEGTFTRRPGLLRFFLGAFVAAVEAGAPVVPIAIRGTRSMLRSDSWFPRRGAISVTVGEPLDPREIKAGAKIDDWTLALKLRDLAREEILRHSGEPDLAHERADI